MQHAKRRLLRWCVLAVLCAGLLSGGAIIVSQAPWAPRRDRFPSPPVAPQIDGTPPHPVPTTSQLAAFRAAAAVLREPTLARGYLTTPNELRRAALLAQAGVEPYQSAVKQALRAAATALAHPPAAAPALIDIRESGNIEQPAFLATGSKDAYAWAIGYNLLRDSQPTRAHAYAQAAADAIMAMPRQNTQVSGYQANTRLNIAVHLQTFIYAADLLADWVPPGGVTPFAQSTDAQVLKTWLGTVMIRYPYNVGHTRVTNWGAWGRLTSAVIADYVGTAAPLYVQRLIQDARGAYQVAADTPCTAGATTTCIQLEAATIYTDALQTHLAMVDGKLAEFTDRSCDARGFQSMIRPDGGLPDELRRQYRCDSTHIPDPYGPAARYSQFATEAMVCLAEVAWRRGDPSIYTHIDPATGRGALYRSLEFLIANHVRLKHGAMLEIANRFYTYAVGIEPDAAKRQAYQQMLDTNLPGILTREGERPVGTGFVGFGTLTHGFAPDESLRPPPRITLAYP